MDSVSGGPSAARSGLIALTHLPSPQLGAGERTHLGRTVIDAELAAAQHTAFRDMLAACGAHPIALDVNGDLPDAVFLEDTAIVLDEIAILGAMGAASRASEPDGVEAAIRQYREVVRVRPPATLEGGDVLRIGRRLLVGISSRTNRAGAQAIEEVGRRHGYRVTPVKVERCLHLKTACTALPDGRLLLNPQWMAPADLEDVGSDALTVPPDEPFAANVLLVDGAVCLAAEHSRTAEMLRGLGFDVRQTPLSEFAKAEGGATCLALVFQGSTHSPAK